MSFKLAEKEVRPVQMTLGEAIRSARMRRRWTQSELARRVPTHPRVPGYWETEEREPDLPTLRRLVEVLDDVEFTLAAVRHVTGGLFGTVTGQLCGVRTAVAIAVAQELDELRDDLGRTKLELLRDPALAERETLISVLSNMLDVHATINQFVIELSRDYGLCLREAHARHVQEMKRKGYIAAKANGRPLPRTA